MNELTALKAEMLRRLIAEETVRAKNEDAFPYARLYAITSIEECQRQLSLIEDQVTMSDLTGGNK